jgi:hypothetical protein
MNAARPNYRRLRLFSLAVFLALWAIACSHFTLEAFGRAWPTDYVDVLVNLGFSLCVVAWLWADSAARDVRIIHTWSWLMFLFWPVIWPAYLIWRGRWWGMLEAGVYLAAIFAAIIAGGIVGALLAVLRG